MQLLPRLAAGFAHAVIAMDGDDSALSLLPAGTAVERLPRPQPRSFLGSACSFAALLRQRRPDLLLTYNWGAIEAVAAARWLGLAAVVHHEEGFGKEELVHRLRRRNWLRRLLLPRVGAVIVPSRNLLGIAQREWRLGARLHHLPNGVDLLRFRPVEPRAEPPARPFTVGTVGGLRAEKDQATLLAAVAAMRAPARVLLVGDGPERPALQAQAQALGLRERAVFVGSSADTAPHYRAMDVFALSSRTEQMPLSLLEAMAGGLPVAGTDVGDVAIMLPEPCRAAIVPAGDHLRLSAALDALAADAARCRREGELNRRHCEQHYELGACLDRFIALYEATAAR